MQRVTLSMEKNEEKENNNTSDADATNNDCSPSKTSSHLYPTMSWTCNILMFLYGTAYWMQKGAFPFLVKQLHINTRTYGYLETVYSVTLLISGPFFGRFGDRFGARAAMLSCFMGSFVFYFFMAIATNVVHLFISRLTGFLLHGLEASQMIMTDVTGPSDRAFAFGRLNFFYSMGVIVGPTLGGWVSAYYSEQFVAGIASLLMVVAIVIVVILVPAQTKDPEKITEQASSLEGGVFNIKAIVTLLSMPEVFYLVMIKLVVGVPVGVFRVMFSFVIIDKFSLSTKTNGYLLTYTGILSALMQAFGIKYFTNRFSSDYKLLLVVVGVKTASFLLLAWASNIRLLILVLIPLMMSNALMSTVMNGALTKAVPETATGTSIGLSMATQSLVRTVSPSLGAWLYSTMGYSSIGLLGYVMNGVVVVVMMCYS